MYDYQHSGKIIILMELLKLSLAHKDRCLVFSKSILTLDYLSDVFNEHNISFLRLDGNTRPPERQKLIDRFNSNEKYSVFLLSTLVSEMSLIDCNGCTRLEEKVSIFKEQIE